MITIFSAEAIGLQQDVGSLEAGKLADLLVLDKNPLENIRNTNSIRYVMKNGELYEGDTLNMVWPRAEAAAEAVLVGHGAEGAGSARSPPANSDDCTLARTFRPDESSKRSAPARFRARVTQVRSGRTFFQFFTRYSAVRHASA